MNDFHAQVNQRENQDSIVTTRPVVSGDGADEGHGVDPKRVESMIAENLLSHAKSTGNTVGAVDLRNATSSRAGGQLGTNTVVVDVGGSWQGDVSHKTRS